MNRNIKKAPVKIFGKKIVVISAFYADFCFCSKSVIITTLMNHLVIGQRQKAPNFSAFHWSPHGGMVSIDQHFVTTRVEHLPKRTETSLITESDRSGPYHRIGPGCAGRA